MLSISALAQGSPIAAYLLDIAAKRGCVKVMFAGDSHMGNDAFNQGGLRTSIALGLEMLGLPCVYAGQVTGNSGNNTWLYNTFGNVTYFHAEGGINIATLLKGDSTLGDLTFENALKASGVKGAPDIVFCCIGSNTTLSVEQAQLLAETVYAYNKQCPLVMISPFASNSVTVEYYNVDTSRAADKEDIRAALLAANAPGPYILVDADKALGMHTWYPIDRTPYLPDSTDTGAETVTFTSDTPGWYTGQEVQVGATIGGLTAGTTYYVARTAVGVYTFHTTRANARSGSSAVNLTANITKALSANYLNASNNNANGVFYDGSHLQPEGYAMIGAHAIAQTFGASTTDILSMLCTAQPFAPYDWNFARAVSGATVSMIPCPFRKTTLEKFIVYNSDASATATVTLNKVRYSNDLMTLGQSGATIAVPMTQEVFTVPAGATVGWTMPSSSDPSSRTCPVAHYNEGWQVIAATAAVLVRASGKQVVF